MGNNLYDSYLNNDSITQIQLEEFYLKWRLRQRNSNNKQINQIHKNCQIWYNVKNPHLEIQEHQFQINSEQELGQHIKNYQFRKHHHRAIAAHQFSYKVKQQSLSYCSKIYEVSLFLERIPTTFLDLIKEGIKIQFPDFIYVYHQVFQGFYQLSKYFQRFFKVTEEMIGINHQGFVKLWIHPNFKSYSIQKVESQNLMIREILKIIQKVIDDRHKYHQILQNQYLKINERGKKLSFADLFSSLTQYFETFNFGMIPQKIKKYDTLETKIIEKNSIKIEQKIYSHSHNNTDVNTHKHKNSGSSHTNYSFNPQHLINSNFSTPDKYIENQNQKKRKTVSRFSNFSNFSNNNQQNQQNIHPFYLKQNSIEKNSIQGQQSIPFYGEVLNISTKNISLNNNLVHKRGQSNISNTSFQCHLRQQSNNSQNTFQVHSRQGSNADRIILGQRSMCKNTNYRDHRINANLKQTVDPIILQIEPSESDFLHTQLESSKAVLNYQDDIRKKIKIKSNIINQSGKSNVSSTVYNSYLKGQQLYTQYTTPIKEMSECSSKIQRPKNLNSSLTSQSSSQLKAEFYDFNDIERKIKQQKKVKEKNKKQNIYYSNVGQNKIRSNSQSNPRICLSILDGDHKGNNNSFAMIASSNKNSEPDQIKWEKVDRFWRTARNINSSYKVKVANKISESQN